MAGLVLTVLLYTALDDRLSGASIPADTSQQISKMLRPSDTRRGLSSLPKREKSPEGHEAGKEALGNEDLPFYRGTTIVMNDRAGRDTVAFQRTVAEAFGREDPCPASRTAHYEWLPHYDAFPVWNLGWHGTIREVERQGDGAAIVKIRFVPHLYSRALKTLVLDEVEETYRIEGHKIQLLGSDAGIPRPRLQCFPVHL